MRYVCRDKYHDDSAVVVVKDPAGDLRPFLLVLSHLPDPQFVAGGERGLGSREKSGDKYQKHNEQNSAGDPAE